MVKAGAQGEPRWSLDTCHPSAVALLVEAQPEHAGNRDVNAILTDLDVVVTAVAGKTITSGEVAHLGPASPPVSRPTSTPRRDGI